MSEKWQALPKNRQALPKYWQGLPVFLQRHQDFTQKAKKLPRASPPFVLSLPVLPRGSGMFLP
ncbi:MAG: hypothetical protein IIW37_05715, partial [Bacteroidaceae bacterium]|nr:hypothetical protein [Bacteroidaceae bacterium]